MDVAIRAMMPPRSGRISCSTGEKYWRSLGYAAGAPFLRVGSNAAAALGMTTLMAIRRSKARHPRNRILFNLGHH